MSFVDVTDKTIGLYIEQLYWNSQEYMIKSYRMQETLPLKHIFELNAKHFYVFLYVS